MMARRRKPRPARRSALTNTPCASGPRCSRRSRIETSVSLRTGAPSNVSSPQIPHMTRKPRLYERIDRIDAIGPSDLLTLVYTPGVVTDRHFDDPSFGEQELRGQLGLEVEADAAKTDAVEHMASKHFVRRLHVGQPRAEQHVRKCREQSVAEPGPKRDACRGLEKARAVHDVGLAGENRRNQPSVFLRIELEVGVLDQDDVAGRVSKPQPDGCALADVDLQFVNGDSRIGTP